MYRRLLIFAFCQYRRFFKAIIDDGFEDSKAIFAVMYLQSIWTLSVFGSVVIANGQHFRHISRGSSLLLAASIVAAWAILDRELWERDVWKRLEGELASMSSTERMLGRVVLAFATILPVYLVYFEGPIIRSRLY